MSKRPIHHSVQQVINEAEEAKKKASKKREVPKNLDSLINGIVQNSELYDTFTLKTASRARLEKLYRKFVFNESVAGETQDNPES